MRHAILPLSLLALLCGAGAASAQDHLKVAIGNRNVGETFVTELGDKAGIFRNTQVMSGQIDVGWAGAPFGVQALADGKIRVVMKSSEPPELNKQTVRLIIANATELAQRRDTFVGFMRAYRETLDWLYGSPDALKAYSAYSGMSEGATKRALQEFLPREALDPDRLSAVDFVMADAVSFKYLPAPLSKTQLDELIQIPERKPQASQ